MFFPSKGGRACTQRIDLPLVHKSTSELKWTQNSGFLGSVLALKHYIGLVWRTSSMKLSLLSSAAAVLPACWQQSESSRINSRNLISIVLETVITEWGESCGSNECLVTVWKLPWLVYSFPALYHEDSGKFLVSLMHVWSPCKWCELQGRIHSTHPNFMPILGCFWKGIASIKWLLLEKTDFSDVSLPAHLLLLCVSCFPTRAPVLND